MSNGNFAGGDGTTSNPYLIEDAADLNAVRNNMSASYKLIKNIDLNIEPYNTGEGWTPIGNYSTKFTGVFDGNGHIISDLFINKPSINYIGLFGWIDVSATIKNIGLKNLNIAGKSNSGGLVGTVSVNSIVSNCYSEGNITGSFYVGGIVGYIVNGTISNCYSTANITATNSNGGD